MSHNPINHNKIVYTGAYNPDSTGASKTVGYASDSGNSSSTTKSGINTTNITITGNGNTVIPAEAGIQNITQANIADIHTTTTTDQVEANSGAIANNFDAAKVQSELDLQVRVTQQFDQTRQDAKAILNKKIDEANKKKEEAKKQFEDGTITLDEYKEVVKQAEDTTNSMQNVGILVDAISGGLYAPADGMLGTAVNTLSPAVVYEIGQQFKGTELENTATHYLAQALVGAVTAGLAGNDALSAGLSAGGAEALAEPLAKFLGYISDGQNPSEMTAEQKETISAIISLGSMAVGATMGSLSDSVASGVAGSTAVEENYTQPVAEKLAQQYRDKGINVIAHQQNKKDPNSWQLQDPLGVGYSVAYGKNAGQYYSGDAKRNLDNVVAGLKLGFLAGGSIYYMERGASGLIGGAVVGSTFFGIGYMSNATLGSGSPKDFVNNMIKTKTQEVILNKFPSFNRF